MNSRSEPGGRSTLGIHKERKLRYRLACIGVRREFTGIAAQAAHAATDPAELGLLASPSAKGRYFPSKEIFPIMVSIRLK
jgi:hypothetical protein